MVFIDDEYNLKKNEFLDSQISEDRIEIAMDGREISLQSQVAPNQFKRGLVRLSQLGLTLHKTHILTKIVGSRSRSSIMVYERILVSWFRYVSFKEGIC
jgi:hypothetical protein